MESIFGIEQRDRFGEYGRTKIQEKAFGPFSDFLPNRSSSDSWNEIRSKLKKILLLQKEKERCK